MASRTDDENLEKLKVARDQMIDRLLEVTSKPKPTYDIDNQKVDWTTYTKMLKDGIRDLNDQIAALDGPFEEQSIIYPL